MARSRISVDNTLRAKILDKLKGLDKLSGS